jgi:hypothetical protein
MKKITDSVIAFLVVLALLPCVVSAQGSNRPLWLDEDIRNMRFPQETFYSSFETVVVTSNKGQEAAMNRARQSAIGRLSERVRVFVNSNKTSVTVSTTQQSINREMEEQINSRFSTIINTISNTEVPNSKVETYFDATTQTAYAFAFVSRTDLSNYYQNQISLWLNEVDGALKTATDLAERGRKMQAKKQCEEVIEIFAKVLYAQDLLTAINSQADRQQNRSQRLRNTLIQTLADLENSIYIFVEITEMVDGEQVEFIADRLPGILTEKDCNCNFTEFESEADFVIKVNARLTRCNDAPNDVVFCYANATVSVTNTFDLRPLRPRIEEKKGGWTNGNRNRAIEDTFDKLAKEIAEKIIPIIKR